MTYTFTSAAGPRVTYLGAIGDEILRHAGKTPGPRGVIVVGEIDAVLARLAAAVAREEAATVAHPAADAPEADSDADEPPPVALARRLVPFLDLLRRAQAAGKDVTWGI
jgi:hypothetical protein